MAFEIYVDLAADVILVLMFSSSGTFQGADVGAIAGLMFNATVFVLKRFNGWDELRTVTCATCRHSHREWVTHEGVGWWLLVPPFLRQRIRAPLRARDV